MLWVILALLALIVALLVKQDALQLVQSLSDEERRPTESECRRLRELFEKAQAADLSTLSLNPLLEALERLCP